MRYVKELYFCADVPLANVSITCNEGYLINGPNNLSKNFPGVSELQSWCICLYICFGTSSQIKKSSSICTHAI